ncbi:hypothetical protein OQA88_11680 [Cercophora sp. LCS_1]
MPRFLITGSSDPRGLGMQTAHRLLAAGHSVVLHARSPSRAAEAKSACPQASAVLVGDLSSSTETKTFASEANELGPYEAVIHNAAIYTSSTPGDIFRVNVLAPYILTSLMDKPKRLVYVSSGLHRSGVIPGSNLQKMNYNDSKLAMVMFAKAFSRKLDVDCYAVDPGWVPTKMGGAGATGDLDEGVKTFVMAALGEGAAKGRKEGYFAGSKLEGVSALAEDQGAQNKLLGELASISGVTVE